MELVESRFGVLAKDVVQNLLLLGHTKVSDLADAYGTANKAHTNGNSKEHTGTNGVNGVKSGNGKSMMPISSAGQLDHVLAQLLQSGFVEPVIERMFRSPTDTHNLVETVMLHDNYGGQTKGTRQKEELKIKVRQQMKSWRDEGRDWKPVGSQRSGGPANGANQGKKRRLSRSEATVNGNHPFQDEGFRLDVGS